LDLTLNQASDPAASQTRIVIHASNLIQCFTDALPLLPEAHLELLKVLKEHNFPPDAFAKLFLIRFLFRATVNWLKASACEDFLTHVERVLVAIGENHDDVKKLYRAAFHAHSRSDIPELFLAFDQVYILYFFCVNDINFLARILHDEHHLPHGLSLNEFSEVDQRYRNYWFWCQVFPKELPRAKSALPSDPLVFGKWLETPPDHASPHVQSLLRLAASFEHNLMLRFKLEHIQAWQDVIETQVTHLMRLHLECLGDLRPAQLSSEIRQVLAIRAIHPDFLSRHTAQLLKFSESWDSMTAPFRDSGFLKKLLIGRPLTRSTIWTGIRELLCLRRSPLAKAFPVLFKWVVRFHTAARELPLGGELLCSIYGQLPCEVVLVPFIVLNETVAQVRGFMPEAEQRIWLAFQTCILTMLQNNEKVMKVIIAVGEQIKQEYHASNTQGR
jgi:hypothetical protein